MEVTLISSETIKPSSPTPSHLKSFEISLIDKIALSIYVPFVSFYKFPPNDQHLKESLSKTLTLFYPLAGVIKEDLTVDCDDSGSLFITTRVNCSLASFLGESSGPKIDLLYKLIPEVQKRSTNQIVIQLNKFECERVAICVSFLHKMIDAISISEFFKCWGCICNGNKKESRPDFSSPQFFEHEALPKAGLDMFLDDSHQVEANGISMRFVFDVGAMSTLQEKARTEYVPKPTRVEVVSAFIWKHCMLASKPIHGSQYHSSLTQTIDLRRRMTPPLPKSSVGNITWFGLASYKGTFKDNTDQLQTDNDFGILVRLIRESIAETKDKFLYRLQNGKVYEAICESLQNLKDRFEGQDSKPYMVTSWCKIGLYEVDFGCGKPIWVSQIGNRDVELPYENHVVLMDGDDDNIEAWVVLAKNEMLELKLDLEFLAFATPNPPIFIK